jgi:hypothetical protein
MQAGVAPVAIGYLSSVSGSWNPGADVRILSALRGKSRCPRELHRECRVRGPRRVVDSRVQVPGSRALRSPARGGIRRRRPDTRRCKSGPRSAARGDRPDPPTSKPIARARIQSGSTACRANCALDRSTPGDPRARADSRHSESNPPGSVGSPSEYQGGILAAEDRSRSRVAGRRCRHDRQHSRRSRANASPARRQVHSRGLRRANSGLIASTGPPGPCSLSLCAAMPRRRRSRARSGPKNSLHGAAARRRPVPWLRSKRSAWRRSGPLFMANAHYGKCAPSQPTFALGSRLDQRGQMPMRRIVTPCPAPREL